MLPWTSESWSVGKPLRRCRPSQFCDTTCWTYKHQHQTITVLWHHMLDLQTPASDHHSSVTPHAGPTNTSIRPSQFCDATCWTYKHQHQTITVLWHHMLDLQTPASDHHSSVTPHAGPTNTSIRPSQFCDATCWTYKHQHQTITVLWHHMLDLQTPASDHHSSVTPHAGPTNTSVWH